LRLLKTKPRPARLVKETSGKKTQHEKGMTTGSSTRSRANKGDAANPSGQGNVDLDNDSMAAPKRGEKY